MADQASLATPLASKVRRNSSKQANPSRKNYVLDTNVLLHDPSALFQFQEHDIILPLVVLEELDRHKKGTADIARNARQVTRQLDALLQNGSLEEGFPLTEPSNGRATGRLFFRSAEDIDPAGKNGGLEKDKADNQILACAMSLLKVKGDSVLVTKDINLRVKALACDIPAQDYRSDKVFTDSDVLPSGYLAIDSDFWVTYQKEEGCAHKKGRHCTALKILLPLNSYLVEDIGSGRTRLWRVEWNDGDRESEVSVVQSDESSKDALVEAQNNEQAMALDLLRDPNIDLAALLGQAGTGKTLLAIAAGLEQVKAGRYQNVLVTRATVPMGEEIGFLPGTEEEKMNAWLGGTLRDVYAALGATPEDSANKKKVPLSAFVEIASMSFMRGRSFQNKYIVIDEAQNLTVHQMRALLTRAGEGSKVVLTGNLGQIDSPYLDEGSSGLAWAVQNLQDWQHAGHLILTEGVRSRLATYVEEVAGRREAN